MELKIQNMKSDDLKKRFHELCGFYPKFYDFPGSLPVSLSKNDVRYLSKNYTVCDKTDGTRYMLFSSNNNMYLVDRLMNFFHLGVCKTTDYVYDGELVKSSENDVWYFMIFDVFAHDNKTIKDIPDHYKRISKVMSLFPQRIQSSTFRLMIDVKRFYYTRDFHKCVSTRLPYNTDGFIFTPIYRKIFNGTDKRTYKWKNSKDHTIDFELQEDGCLYLWDKNNTKIKICPVEYDDENTKQEHTTQTKTPCIVECKISQKDEETIWVYVKCREDKERPNSMKTYLSTIEVIKEDITIEYLNNNLSIL